AIAMNTLTRDLNTYPKSDVRYTKTFEEEIATIKAAKLVDVKKFYQEFYGASQGQIAFVGDFDAKEVTKLTQDLFGNWQSQTPYERLVEKYDDIAPINKAIETPDKTNAFLIAGLQLKISDNDPDYPALALANFMIGESSLYSRLGNRLRQKDGLSYSVGSILN